MSSIKLESNASGTGIFTIASPNSNTNRTLTLPDAAGTIQVSGNPISGTTGDFSGDLSFNSGYGSSAVAYGCRAWVNFNGTGTVAIRASGNVTSITDNGVGDYTVNFTTAMVDTNYCADSTCEDFSTYNFMVAQAYTRNTGSVLVSTRQNNSTIADARAVYIAIFR